MSCETSCAILQTVFKIICTQANLLFKLQANLGSLVYLRRGKQLQFVFTNMQNV